MKTMKKTIFILAIIGLTLGACDKIESPYLEPVGNTGTGPGPGEKVRKILLEEFTGHICVNCPEATQLARDLKIIYGEQLVLLSIHAGDLAVPGPSPYEAEYRTIAGTTIYNYYQPIGVPVGMVNRELYQGSAILFKDSWEPAIQELIDLPPEASMEIETEYNDGNRKLDIHVNSEFLQDISRSVNINILIIESEITSAQKNDLASIGDVPDILDYQHQHILRQSVNGPWGDFMVDQPAAGYTMTTDYSITLNPDWDAQNVAVISIILDSGTYEILQVEEVHIQ